VIDHPEEVVHPPPPPLMEPLRLNSSSSYASNHSSPASTTGRSKADQYETVNTSSRDETAESTSPSAGVEIDIDVVELDSFDVDARVDSLAYGMINLAF
jgi:hypothetical protein